MTSAIKEFKGFSPNTLSVEDGIFRLKQLQTDPTYFLKLELGINKIWDGQKDILKKIASYNRVSVASGHALGKDYITAAIILWFLYCFPPAIVIATAPSARQVEKVIWGELGEKFNNAKRPLGGRLLNTQLIVSDKMRWYAIGFTTKDVHKQQGKFQGFHQKNILVVFSEAQAIERTIWEQAESLMTAGNAKWLAIGNPLVPFGSFYETFQPGTVWENIWLDCENSPNVRSGKEIIPGLCSKKWVDEMAKKYGKTHPIYITKVKGQFVKTGTNALVQPEWLDWAANSAITYSSDDVLIAGVDPARHGENKTIITIRRGMKVIEVQKYEKRTTTEVTGEIVQLLTRGIHRVNLDVGGLGIGIYDRLVELGYASKICAVNFGAMPVEKETISEPKSSKVLKEKIKFADMATQIHYNLANLLENKRISVPYDEALSMQLLNRKINLQSNGKLKLENKEDFKARGYESPDEADSLALCFMDIESNLTQAPYAEVIEDEELNALYKL